MGTKRTPAMTVAGNANGANALAATPLSNLVQGGAVTTPWFSAPGTPPASLTLSVTLNPKDAETITKMAEEEYRTPAQQVGYITSQWLKQREQMANTFVTVSAGGTNPVPPTLRIGSPEAMAARASMDVPPAPVVPPPVAPDVDLDTLIPVYHVGDGTAGSGCGKPGLLFTRELKGTVRPGDVRHCGGAQGCRIHSKAEGEAFGKGEAMSCCQCGGAMSPATWSYDADSEDAEMQRKPARRMAKMSAPGG